MKRSKALWCIEEVILAHRLPLPDGLSAEILGRLEAGGMLPPEWTNRKLPEILYGETGNANAGYILAWSPENDET